MIIFYLTIPLMLLAVGLAVTPLLWAMKRQFESEARIDATNGTQEVPLRGDADNGRVADVVTPYADTGAMAA